jgi:hypothetical protein
MHQVLTQLLHFLQQGIAAIFRLVEMVWGWSVDQIGKLMAVPWQEWPWWKVLLLVLIAAVVILALYRAAWELWLAGVRILAGFAALLAMLVQTLPSVLLAGLVALGGVWMINHLDDSLLTFPTAQAPPPSDRR